MANLPVAVTFAYDLNGNMRTNGTRILDYDDENQLIRVTEPSTWKSEVSYDGKLRRRVRTEFVWTNSAWATSQVVRYVYDGNMVIQERDQYNVPQITYTRGRDLSGSFEGAGGIGGLLALSQVATLSPQHFYYHADANGNVTALLSTNQQVAARYIYDPFGNTLSASGPMADVNLYRFSSKELHAASGLVYYLYRFYDPNLQRWPIRDPLGESGFAALQEGVTSSIGEDLNVFAFIRNSPVDYIDPWGLSLEDDLNNARKDMETAKRLFDENQKILDQINKSVKPGEPNPLFERATKLRERQTELLKEFANKKARYEEIQEALKESKRQWLRNALRLLGNGIKACGAALGALPGMLLAPNQNPLFGVPEGPGSS